jgi:hypothetical protein
MIQKFEEHLNRLFPVPRIRVLDVTEGSTKLKIACDEPLVLLQNLAERDTLEWPQEINPVPYFLEILETELLVVKGEEIFKFLLAHSELGKQEKELKHNMNDLDLSTTQSGAETPLSRSTHDKQEKKKQFAKKFGVVQEDEGESTIPHEIPNHGPTELHNKKREFARTHGYVEDE